MQAISVTTPIFLMIAIGYFFKRKGLFSASTMKETNRFLYWAAMPSLIFRNIFSANVSMFQDSLLPLILSIPLIIMVLLGWYVGKYNGENPERLSVTVMGAVRSNQIFVGFPIAWLAFGQSGLEAAAVYLAMTLVIFQFLSIGGAQLALGDSFSPRAILQTFKTLMKNPLFIATILSMTLLMLNFHKLPSWLDKTLEMLADVGSGMALLMVGTEVVFDNLGEKLKRVRKILVLRLIVHPLITFVILYTYGAPIELVRVATVLSGTPIAVNSLIVAKGMGMDSGYMTDAVITSTVFSMFTLTAILFMMGV